MKKNISFLAILAIALNINCVHASECIYNDCNLTFTDTTNDTNADISKSTVNFINAEQLTSCNYDYSCPFESMEECAIWYKKPLYKTVVTPRAPHINPFLIEDILYTIHSNLDITANEPAMAPLLSRYKMLMAASQSCCTSGIVYRMQQANVSESTIYKFLKDDSNYFATTIRCMVTPDNEIASNYSHGVHGQMIADVRNACVCKNHQWFETLLQPFVDIYEHEPEFKNSGFLYKYTDGLKRNITVSVNNEVQTVLDLLKDCPK